MITTISRCKSFVDNTIANLVPYTKCTAEADISLTLITLFSQFAVKKMEYPH